MIDPRTLEALKNQLKATKDSVLAFPKGSEQRANAEEQVRQQEKQLARVTGGTFGVAQ